MRPSSTREPLGGAAGRRDRPARPPSPISWERRTILRVVIALIQDRYLNASRRKIDGVDLARSKRPSCCPEATLDTFVNVSWLKIVQQTLATTPPQTLTGTLFNPPKVRLRSGLTWTYGGFSSTGILNYISGETDTAYVTPKAEVGSWTTVDLTPHLPSSGA